MLGVYVSSLDNSVRQAREEAAGAPSAEERAEIRELKRELGRLTRDRDIPGEAVMDAHTVGTKSWWVRE